MRPACSAGRTRPLLSDVRQSRGCGNDSRANQCCGTRLTCKRSRGYHVDHPVVRGQRHDQATFSLAARVCGFAWEKAQGRLPIRHEAGFCVAVGRQYGCLTVIRSSCNRQEGEGSSFDFEGSAVHSRILLAAPPTAKGRSLTSAGGPSAHLTQRRPPICLQQRAALKNGSVRPALS